MASSRKRQRVEDEDTWAECPFSVELCEPNSEQNSKPTKKKTKSGAGRGKDREDKMFLQNSPFSPSGRFQTHEVMDRYYRVHSSRPGQEWSDLTRYNSFVLNSEKYLCEGFVWVSNEHTVERQKHMDNNEPMKVPEHRSEEGWVARILEIRAADEHHVYARVYWMYWPDELPKEAHDAKGPVVGRQKYHGYNELIASNHMEVINVVSVMSKANVTQWYEESEEIPSALFWRQAFDCRTNELSSAQPTCSCGRPRNPHTVLMGCSNPECETWLHEECLVDEALTRTLARLGRDKPHIPPSKTADGETEPKRPLSPTEPGAAVSNHPIDVKTDRNGADGEAVITAAAADETAPAPAASKPSATEKPGDASGQSTQADQQGAKGKKLQRKGSKILVKNKTSPPWEGLFSAKVLNYPARVEIKDLREGVEGGVKVWEEDISCLRCGKRIT